MQENEQIKTNKLLRNSNIELFRIVSMLAIVAHHYFMNSGIYEFLMSRPVLGAKEIFILIFGWGGKTGINCFIMITGYFMCKSQISARKYIKLIAEVEFYNITIYFIFWLTGYMKFSLIGFIKAVFLFSNISDGFTSCFLVFYLFIPFLNKMLQSLTEKEHRCLIILCLTVCSVLPLIGSQVVFSYVIWFGVIYVIAAYVRMHPRPCFDDAKLWRRLALGSLLLSWASIPLTAWIYLVTCGDIGWPYKLVHDVNMPFAVITAVCAFMFFKNLKIGYSKTINTIAASAFGVLCIHANGGTMRQWLWHDVCNNVGAYQTNYTVLHAFGCVIIIYAICTAIDVLRIWLLERPFLEWVDKKAKQKYIKAL